MSTNDTIRDLAARIKADPDDDEAIDALVRAARRRRAVGQVGASPASVLKYTVAVNERRIQEQWEQIAAHGVRIEGDPLRGAFVGVPQAARDAINAGRLVLDPVAGRITGRIFEWGEPNERGEAFARGAFDQVLAEERQRVRGRFDGVSPFTAFYQASFPDDDLNRELDSRAAIGERQRLHPAALDIYHPLHAPITRITRLNADDHHDPILGILDQSAHPVRWDDDDRPDVVDAMVAAHDLARRALPPVVVDPDMPPDLAVIRGANGAGAVLRLTGGEETDDP